MMQYIRKFFCTPYKPHKSSVIRRNDLAFVKEEYDQILQNTDPINLSIGGCDELI